MALLGSMVFYAWGAPVFCLVLLVSGCADFALAPRLTGTNAKRWLWVGLGYNLLTLFIFKYFNFFLDNAHTVADALGLGFPQYMEIALPLGISFFTFQKISYLVDVYRQDTEPSQNLVDYLLFVSLFPQLIAGPIVRYKEISQQLRSRFESESWEQRLSGFYRFVLGLAKKVLIADTLAQVVNAGFEHPEFGAAHAWIALLAFAMQIYFDFSGYSDMAIGLGQMMGFRLPENFNWPYLARGFRDFWHRWHITLSAWMRDYLYLPLGGSRSGAARTVMNLWIVFLLSGLWHGDRWNFVIWGAWHGVFISLDRFTGLFKRSPSFLAIPTTFLLVLLGWVWFRAETLAQAGDFFQALVDFDEGHSMAAVIPRQWAVLIIASVSAFIPQGFHMRLDQLSISRNTPWDIAKFVAALILLVLCVGQMAVSSGQPFIYFRF